MQFKFKFQLWQFQFNSNSIPIPMMAIPIRMMAIQIQFRNWNWQSIPIPSGIDPALVSDRPIRSTSTLSSSYSDALASRRRPGISCAPRSDRTTRQRSDRGSKPSVANSGLLQSNILGAEEGRRFPTSIRLEGSECLCREGEVQNDHSSSSDKRIAHLFIANPEGSMIHQYYKKSLKTQLSSRYRRHFGAPQ